MKIESYTFGPPWSKTKIDLYAEKLIVSGKDDAGNYIDDEIEIKNLSGKKVTVRAKDDIRKAVFGLPGILVFIGSIYFWERMAAQSTIIFYSVIFGSIALMLVGFLFASRVKIYAYKNKTGEILFSFSDKGNDIQKMEEFSMKVDEVIKAQPVDGADGTR